MSGTYQNSGSLNRTREKTSDRAPDFYGRLEITGEVLQALNEGKPIRLAGWMREGRYGEFISLKAAVEKPRQEQERATSDYDVKAAERAERERMPAQQSAVLTGDFDDDIPF